VEDPTKISSRQEKQVKKYVQDYFEKAVAKKREHEKKKAERKAKDIESGVPAASVPSPDVKKDDESDVDQDMAMSDDEEEKVNQDSKTPVTPLDQLLIVEGLKRKRDEDNDPNSTKKEDDSATPSKRTKPETPLPPPPPPIPGNIPEDPSILSNEPLDDELSTEYPSGSYRSPLDNDDAMQESPAESGPPPPPPPVSNATKVVRRDANISGHAQSPDTPVMTSPDNEDENVENDNQHFSNHRHGQPPEVQVHGGA